MLISFYNSNSYKLWRNIILCIAISICYTTSIGWIIHLEALAIALDTALTVSLLFIGSIALWNIYSYAIPDSINNLQSLSLHILYCCMCVLFIVGIESVFIYAIFPKSFTSFATTLPLRAFCITLLYIVHREYHDANKKIQEDSEDEIIEENTTVKDPIERITVKVGQKIKVILVTDLIYLKAEDDYVAFFTTEGHWLKTGTMKDFEATLPSNKFVRIHRSYIVNIDKIVKIERYGQQQQLQLTTGERIRISPNGYKILRTKLNL